MQPTDESSIDRVVDAYKAGIDLTLIDRNLRLTPEERLRQLMQLQRFADELRWAGEKMRTPLTGRRRSG